MTTALRLHCVGKHFEAGFQSCRARVAALAGIDLELAFGEVVAIIGPAASGKTTLLQCAAGILQPSSGSIVRAAPLAFGPVDRPLVMTKLSHTPTIYVWDDPVGGLTPISVRDLARWLRRTRDEGHAILVSSRSSDLLDSCHARGVILEHGRVARDVPRAARDARHCEPRVVTSPRRAAAAPRTNSRRRSPSDRPTPASP